MVNISFLLLIMGVQFGYDNFDILKEGTKPQISLENTENNVYLSKNFKFHCTHYLRFIHDFSTNVFRDCVKQR